MYAFFAVTLPLMLPTQSNALIVPSADADGGGMRRTTAQVTGQNGQNENGQNETVQKMLEATEAYLGALNQMAGQHTDLSMIIEEFKITALRARVGLR